MRARRFLNAVRHATTVQGATVTVYSLCRVKVNNNLFYASTAEAQQRQATAAAAAARMKRETTGKAATLEDEDHEVLSLSMPDFQYKPSSRYSHTELRFLPFYGGVHGVGKFLCLDESGHAALYDDYTSTSELMPSLRKPPRPRSFSGGHTISCSVVNGHGDAARPPTLYFMDEPDGSFDALVYGNPDTPPDRMFMSGDMYACWHWRSLPLPPVACPHTGCFALLHGQDDAASSTIIVSFTGRDRPAGWDPVPGGTFCFDTASHEWTKAGDCALPFWGRSHHAPELGDGLLFGLEYGGGRFCAMDISGIKMNRAPVLRHAWLEHTHPPEDWSLPPGHTAVPRRWSLDSSSVEYLGAGRFCIHRSFDIMVECGYRDEEVDETVALLTGVEVVRAPGSSRLRLVKHKTKRLDYEIDYML